jgi:hypothetical protein
VICQAVFSFLLLAGPRIRSYIFQEKNMTFRQICLLVSIIILAWSLPSSSGQDKEKANEITAEKLAEDYAADFGKFDKFAKKYGDKAIRVRGKLKIMDEQAFFIPGKKLSNGKPVMIFLAVSPADLKKYPEDSLVVAESSLLNFNEFRITLNKVRLFPGAKKKPG